MNRAANNLFYIIKYLCFLKRIAKFSIVHVSDPRPRGSRRHGRHFGHRQQFGLAQSVRGPQKSSALLRAAAIHQDIEKT